MTRPRRGEAAAAAEETPTNIIETPAATDAAEGAPVPARRGRRRPIEPDAESIEAPIAETAPLPLEEPSQAALPSSSPARRGRRGSGSSRRGLAPGAEPVAAEAASEPESTSEIVAEAASESVPSLTPSQTPGPGRARRGRRGGRDRGDRERSDNVNGDAGRAIGSTPRNFGVPTPAPRRGDSAGVVEPISRPPRRDSGPSGGVEQLIARQNVLFEEFAQTQAQGMRDLQRTLGGAAQAGGPPHGSGLALPKVAIFFDVPNLIYAAEQIGARVDYGRLLDYLTDGRQLVRATAYAPITDDPMTRFESQRFVLPVINKGWKIVTKPWKRFADGSMKANFDIELAVDILTMSDRLDVVILLSGDGDFRRVCELVESKGVRVEVVSFAASTAMELRNVADHYTDLGSILNLVGS